MNEHKKVIKLYKEMGLLTTPLEELMISLIDEIILSIRVAKDAIDKGDRVEQNRSLKRGQNCILQLMTHVNTKNDQGFSLIEIYDSLYRILVKANIENNSKSLQEVIVSLREHQEDWLIAADKRKQNYQRDLI